jgi:O-antigen ligase
VFDKLTKAALFFAVATMAESFLILFSVSGVNVTPVKVASYALMAMAGLKLLLRAGRLPQNPKNLWMVAFAVGAVPALPVAWLSGAPLTAVLPMAVNVFSLILFYYLVVYVVDTEKDLRVVLWALAVGSAAIAVSSLFGLGRADEGFYERAGGFGGNPNSAGLACVTGIGAALYLISTRGAGLFSRLTLAGLMVLQLVGIVLSVSRAAAGTLVALLGFLIVKLRRLDLFVYLVPGAAAFAALVLVMAPGKYVERISTIGEGAVEISQGGGRAFQYYWGVRAFASNPITGVGLGNLRHWFLSQDERIRLKSTHMAMLEVAAQMGLLGLIPWIAINVLTWLDYSRARRIARQHRKAADPELMRLDRMALYLQGMHFAWLLNGITAPCSFDKQPWLLYAVGTLVLDFARQRAHALDAASDARPVEDESYPLVTPVASPWSPSR